MKSWLKTLTLALSLTVSTSFALSPKVAPSLMPQAPSIDAKAYVLMDAMSGKILAEKNSDEKMPPASLTKMMTILVLSQAIQQDSIKLNDKVHVSRTAWKTGGSRMFIKAGDDVSIEDLIQGVVVASGNDAAVAIAEYMAGDQDAFSVLMNREAARLGMTNSHFTDATGLPHPDHYSTAHDLSLLARAIVTEFPEDYAWYSQKWFTYAGIKQPNRNRLLWRYKYADGLKTGHTDEAGYCLVTSALKDNMRLITVVLGAPSDAARTEDSVRLLNYGFRFFETHKILSAGDAIKKARVYYGSEKNIGLGTLKPLYITIPAHQARKLKKTVTVTPLLEAPIKKGQTLGELLVTLNGNIQAKVPLVALTDNAKGGIFSRSLDYIRYTWHSWFYSA